MTAQDPKRQVLRHFVVMPEETVMPRGLCIQTLRKHQAERGLVMPGARLLNSGRVEGLPWFSVT